jgi:hypothetical protein
MSKTSKEIHVIEKGGKFWGVQYADGYSTSYGYGPIENADHVDPRYCKKPEDATYRGSYLIPELRKGSIRKIRVTTDIEFLT